MFSIRWDEWRGSMDGRPTMWVKRLLRACGRRVDLHKMISADDPDCFHTHPAFCVRLILWGGYVEEMESGARKTWRPGMFGIVRPDLSHRIAGLRNGSVSYSLWLRGPKCAPVRLAGAGWHRQEQTHRAPETVLLPG